MKQKFNFSNIGEDIWIRVEQIRENDLKASEVGNINVNQYNWTEYDFPMKTTYKTNLNTFRLPNKLMHLLSKIFIHLLSSISIQIGTKNDSNQFLRVRHK